MCGISGIVGRGPHAKRATAVRKMTQALAHRGPDGEGFHDSSMFSLGHRRLAIIDPQSGKQPLCNEDGTIWLTYNGEIYNFPDLRQQLLSKGHRFRSHCDSEVIVHAYEQWGPDCVERFRGMFAFALADQNTQTVFMARDQLGIKPLFFRCEPGQVAFASELPALLASTDQRPPVSLRAIEFFLRYRYIPAPDTGYASVYKLPPATYQIFDFQGRKLKEREYWKLSFRPDMTKSEDEWLEAFEATLLESVKAHLIADVPFGAFLSGGIDSTLTVSCMAQLLNSQVRAYTIGFDEAEFSEQVFATQAAETLQVELQHEVMGPDVVDVLQRLFTNYGEPFADTSAVPTWWVSQLARRDVPMVLSGDGADEAFAGYERYGRWLDESGWTDVRNFHRNPKRLLRRVGQRFLQGAASRWSGRWQENFVSLFHRRRRQQLWKAELQSWIDCECPAFALASGDAIGLDKLSFAQYLDIKTYLPGDILTKVDIASMQHGLEVRTPFTDVRMMEFAATLPAAERCSQQSGRRRLKALPKRSLSRAFPQRFIDRAKMGFGIPEATWMLPGNCVRACFDDLVASPSSPLFDYFQRPTVEEMTAEFDQHGRHATALWSIFALALWFEQQTSSALPRAA